MKLCKDCLYYSSFFPNKELSYCKAPNRFTVSPITGEVTYHKEFCSIARADSKYSPMCGSEARWFKPKTPKLRWLKFFLFNK